MTLVLRYFFILQCAVFLVLIQSGSAINLKELFSASVEKVRDIACKHLPCCEFHLNQKEAWLHGGEHLLELIDERLHGQHLAKSMIFEAVSKHMTKPSVWVSDGLFTDDPDFPGECGVRGNSCGNSPKPLRILMYGPTGTGKSYASQLIAESIYKKGLKSPLVHLFAGKSSFPVHSEAGDYLLMLRQWLYGNVSVCPYSMFIFDEFDNWLKSVVSATNTLSMLGTFRNAIFIYIINSGSLETVDTMLELYESGTIREDIQLNQIQKSPHGSIACKTLACLSERIGRQNTLFHNAYLAVTNLLTYFTKDEEDDDDIEIDYIIPFLPLEEKHVRSCTVDHFMDKGRIYPSKEMIDSVLRDVKFGPEEKEVFSTLGCKRIHSLVINALATHYRTRNHEEL